MQWKDGTLQMEDGTLQMEHGTLQCSVSPLHSVCLCSLCLLWSSVCMLLRTGLSHLPHAWYSFASSYLQCSSLLPHHVIS